MNLCTNVFTQKARPISFFGTVIIDLALIGADYFENCFDI